MPQLPEPRTDGPYRIALVCLGNICRSPMAHVVLAAAVDEAGLAGRVEVTSSGTGDWHVGQPMDRRAAAVLTTSGYDASRHRARQFDASWLDDHDLVLAMDESNLKDVAHSAVEEVAQQPSRNPEPQPLNARVRLFREFDPVDPGGEVPDPYYGGDSGFEEVLEMVERTAAAIVAHLRTLLQRERAQS